MDDNNIYILMDPLTVSSVVSACLVSSHTIIHTF